MEPVVLTDPRVVLRPPTSDDIPRMMEACQDPVFQRWTMIPIPYERKHAEEFIALIGTEGTGWSTGTNPGWALCDPADRTRYWGGLDLRLDDDKGAEIGFGVAPWARGKGVATAAVRLACRWAFEELKLERVVWYAFVGNDASKRVAEKVGFTILDGVLRSARTVRGARVDEWVGDLLPGDLR